MLSINGLISHYGSSPSYAPNAVSASQDASNEKSAEEKSNELTEEEKREVKELKNRDREVKAHESAHKAAGGQYVRGGASYEYQTGPDGKKYAVGGEVSIDTSKEKEPEATIRKMQKVRQAALAPAQPSGQDRAAAAQASRQETTARRELAEKEKSGSESGKVSSTFSASRKTHGYSQNGYSTNIPSFAASGKNLNLIA